MSNFEILQEISRQQKIVSVASLKINSLLKELETVDADNWDWLSVKNASSIVDLSIQSIYRLIDSGKLESKSVAGKKFVRKSQLMTMSDYE